MAGTGVWFKVGFVLAILATAAVVTIALYRASQIRSLTLFSGTKYDLGADTWYPLASFQPDRSGYLEVNGALPYNSTLRVFETPIPVNSSYAVVNYPSNVTIPIVPGNATLYFEYSNPPCPIGVSCIGLGLVTLVIVITYYPSATS